MVYHSAVNTPDECLYYGELNKMLLLGNFIINLQLNIEFSSLHFAFTKLLVCVKCDMENWTIGHKEINGRNSVSNS